MSFEVSNSTNLGINRTYIQSNTGVVYYTITGDGLNTFTFTHNETSGYIFFRCKDGAIFDLDNVSVKEIL